MQHNQRNLLRTAIRVSSHLQRNNNAPLLIDLPDAEWGQCHALLGYLDVCSVRNWTEAAGVLKDRLERSLERCADHLQEIRRQVSGFGRLAPLQTIGEIFADLSALSAEFDGVTIDGSNRTLSVTTDPIVLEEIELGPFEIRLHWDRIGERRPYQVVALNPNPAGESSDTTHPHVKGDQLCEGDGQVAIAQALRKGRLLDFFQIVSRILETYNGGSAYVSLSEWNGTPCTDCGAVTGEDDRYTCEFCHDSICQECLSSCARCESFCCQSCATSCRSCEESICSSCQRDCACGRHLCRTCISEGGLCEECQEEHDAESIEDEDPCPSLEPETIAAPSPRESEPLTASSTDAF
jgi:hypothetical protein